MSRSISFRTRTHARIQFPEHPNVQLTEQENDLYTLLDECVTWMKHEKGIDTSCRVAGGWVRDKLLGSPSNDIDIALESIMGVSFAEHLVEFCSNVKKMEVEKIAKIESNPDRSKHLETARTTVLGLELDLVNLRNEEYAEDSRIPTQVTFGTPLQDALRRDITINALFYNVHSRSVEDFTERGLPDLRNGVIRTPLAPRETFMDDPLRVLRCIRFASRLGFELDPELETSTRDPEIQEALRDKISRERVGEEIDKMMKGRDPLRAIQLIHNLSLYDPIFHIPASVATELSSHPAPSHVAFAAASLLHVVTQGDDALPALHPLLKEVMKDKATQARLYLACALRPFHGIAYQDKKKKTVPAVDAAIRESTKLGTQNHYLDGIPILFAAADRLRQPAIETYIGSETERVSIGLILKDRRMHNPHTGSYWPSSLLFSLICELVPLWDPTSDVLDSVRATERINAYNAFVSRTEELDLLRTVEAKSMLDGHDVVRILDAGKAGPWMTEVLHKVTVWELDNPSGTKEDCEAWLRAEHASGVIQIPAPPATGGRQQKVKVKRGNGTGVASAPKKPKIGGDQV
ncbi:hypothetical protein BXZ70DRAFT_899809 [Cristinia sonorae]|uniref:Poly A polymerase head domain-containing protein n=1 Tax=Cristinia sonorae TaxID=1940300 RepID=A0A8K0XLL6_9AGAR|nr:hypothetical protein BXZ70DRAFT_899809 [Cristinia sonorae]